MKLSAFVVSIIVASAPLAGAQHGFEKSSPDGFWRFGMQPVLELTYWHTDTPAPGLLDFGGTDFFQPRLSLAFNVMAGDEWLLHVLTRWDRGFEAGLRPDGDFRVDEALLRWRPLGDGRLNVQIGKFATCFGNWVPRHLYWDNPFLMPPLPYDNQLALIDRSAGAPPPGSVANRATRKDVWLPMIWGASYATGVSISGSTEHWDYAIEVKNANLASRPDSWSPWEENGSHPTVTGRVGYRPDAAWAFGLSASHGNYLRTDAEPTLLAGAERSDFTNTILGADLRWSHRHFEVFSEVLVSRARTTTAADLDSLAYYLEGRWKVNSTVFLAARWAQQWNEDFLSGRPGPAGGFTRETWRATAAAGFRVTENVLVKTEYSHTGASANENVFAVGVGLRF